MTERLDRAWEGVSRPVRTAFMAALVAGLLGHITGIVNFFQNHDSILNIYLIGKTTFGRWLSGTMQSLGGSVTVQSTFILVGVVFIALSSALMASYLRLRSRWTAMLMGTMMALFPSVVTTNAYVAASIIIMGALPLSVLCVFFADRGRLGPALSVAFMTLSMGTYQGHISFAAGLMVLGLILETLRGERTAKELFLRGVKYVCILLLSVALYYAILLAVLKITGTQLYDYRGINNMGSIRWSAIPWTIIEAYKKVARFFLFDRYGENRAATAWLYRAVLLVCAAGYVTAVLKKGILRDIPRLLLSLALLAVFPLAIHLIAVLGQDPDTHWLMIYAFVLLPVMALCFADLLESEEGPERRTRAVTVICACALALSAAESYVWFVITGQCYTALRVGNSAAYADSVELCADLRARGYTEDKPLAFIGDGSAPYFTQPDGAITKRQYTGVVTCEFVGNPAHLYPYLEQIVGFRFTRASDEWVNTLRSDPEIAFDMPVYPAEGSVREIDGVTVVKLSDLSYTAPDTQEDIQFTGPGVPVETPETAGAEAGQGEDYRYVSLARLTDPGVTYKLTANAQLTGADTLDIILYNFDTDSVILRTTVGAGDIEWTFRTPDFLDGTEERSCELLVYAGTRGATGGNTLALTDIRLLREAP